VLCEAVETFPAAELRSHESAAPQVDCGAFFDGQPLHFFDDLQEPIYIPILYVKAARAWLEHLNRNALAFLRLASIRLMLRKLCNPA
jgi:hypothetical protein